MSIKSNFYDLEKTYYSFLSTCPGPKEKVIRDSAQQLFSTALSEHISDPACAAHYTELLKIQKGWMKQCKELYSSTDTLSEKFYERAKKIAKIFREMTLDNELILEHLHQEDVCEALKKELETDGSTHLRLFPSTITTIKKMCERLLNGYYGQNMRKAIYHETKNPLWFREAFIRFLFIDLFLQGQNPYTACSWFKTAENKEEDCTEILKGLNNWKDALSTQTGLAEPEVRALLLDKEPDLPADLKKKYNAFLAHADFSSIRHNAILDIIKPLLAPSDAHLAHVARVLVPTDPQKAVHIVARMKDRAKQSQCIEKLLDHSLWDHFPPDIRVFKLTDPEYHAQRVAATVSYALKNSRMPEIADMKLVVCEIEATTHFDDHLLGWIDLITRHTLDEPRKLILEYLLTCSKSQPQRLKCLSTCFKNILDCSPIHTALSDCTRLLSAQDEATQARARIMLLIFGYARCKMVNIPKELQELMQKLTDKKERLELARLLVLQFSKTQASIYAVDALSNMEPIFTEDEEKKLILKHKVLLLNKFNHKRALELAKSVQDPIARLCLTRLCLSPSKPAEMPRVIVALIDEPLSFNPNLILRMRNFSESRIPTFQPPNY